MLLLPELIIILINNDLIDFHDLLCNGLHSTVIVVIKHVRVCEGRAVPSPVIFIFVLFNVEHRTFQHKPVVSCKMSASNINNNVERNENRIM